MKRNVERRKQKERHKENKITEVNIKLKNEKTKKKVNWQE